MDIAKTHTTWSLVLIALAMAAISSGVLGASQATAAEYTFTSEAAPTKLSGSQVSTLSLTTDTGKVECTWALFSGETEAKGFENVELTPSYSGCKAFGFTATITMNGCKYKIHATESADLVCPAGKDIEIDTQSNACNVTIQPQTGLTSIVYSNGTSSGKADFTATINITNLKYTETGVSCVASGKATTGGKLAGSITLWGTDSVNNPTGISFDKPAPTFTFETSPTKLSGAKVGTVLLTTDVGTAECATSTFAGEAIGSKFSSVEVSPTYSGCTAFGFSMNVTMNGCTYIIYAAGTADLICPAGKDILIDTAFNSCNVTIQAQTGLSSIAFTNGTSGGKGDITADVALTNIKYTENGFACAATGKATTGGKLTGSYTVTGKNTGGSAAAISWDS